MKKMIFCFVLGAISVMSVNSQASLDEVFADIHNDSLYVSPRFGGVSIVSDSTAGKRNPNTRGSVVSTLNSDMEEIVETFTLEAVTRKLYDLLLQDSTRDMFACALLYQLHDNPGLTKFIILPRKEWVSSGKREEDIQYWTTILKSKRIIE